MSSKISYNDVLRGKKRLNSKACDSYLRNGERLIKEDIKFCQLIEIPDYVFAYFKFHFYEEMSELTPDWFYQLEYKLLKGEYHYPVFDQMLCTHIQKLFCIYVFEFNFMERTSIFKCENFE